MKKAKFRTCLNYFITVGVVFYQFCVALLVLFGSETQMTVPDPVQCRRRPVLLGTVSMQTLTLAIILECKSVFVWDRRERGEL